MQPKHHVKHSHVAQAQLGMMNRAWQAEYNLQKVCNSCKCFLGAPAVEGRGLIWLTGECDVAQMQDSCHSAEHSFPLSFPNPHNGHGVQS